MLAKILSLFGRLLNLWTDISDENKVKIVGMIVDAFANVFKAFYKASKAAEEKN